MQAARTADRPGMERTPGAAPGACATGRSMPPAPDPARSRRDLPVRRAFLVVAAVALLMGGVHWVRTSLGIGLDADSVRGLIGESGFWAPIAFVVLVGFRVFLLVPGLGPLLLTIAGAIFGSLSGTLYGALGLTLTACLGFLAVRVIGAGPLQSRVPQRFQPLLDFGRSSSGAAVLTVLSGYPVGPSVWAQGAAAVSGMAFVPFVLAVGLGSGIRAGTYAVFGNALVEGDGVLLSGALVIAAFTLPLLHPRTREVLRAALRPPATGSAPQDGPGSSA